MACLNVKFQKVGTGLTATFAQVCGTGIGEKVLFDKNGAQLYEKNGKYLTYK